MEDIQGITRAPGQKVAYARLMGRCAGLTLGEVLEVKRTYDRYSGELGEEKCRVRPGKSSGWGGAQKDVTLSFGDRIVVIG